jgi:hypothetical protein
MHPSTGRFGQANLTVVACGGTEMEIENFLHPCLLQQTLDGIRGVASLRLLRLARSRVRTWKLRDAKSEKSKEKYKKYSVDWEEEALGSECENGLYASAGRIVHEKRHCDRPIFGIT